MRALYLKEKLVFEEKNIPAPSPKTGEVLIKVKSVGVCGSDIHYWEHGKIGGFIVKEPLILGHELSGEIVEIGAGVCGFSVGDLVVVEPGEVCGKCEACREGRYNLCPDMKFYATPPYDGALREYVAFDSSFVFKVPEGINPEMATLAEPIAVGIFSTRSVKVRSGDKVIIYGSGVIGLCCMIAAFGAGASEVVVTDIREDRLAMAIEVGATATVNSLKDSSEQYNGYFDVAFECSGASACLIDASKKIKWGGKIALLGFPLSSTQEAPISDLIIKEQQLVPTFRYANAFPAALSLLSKNKDKFQKFITHRFSFNDAEKAFKAAHDDKKAVKVVINF
jgi:L-iditol 2-dehydrogenase